MITQKEVLAFRRAFKTGRVPYPETRLETDCLDSLREHIFYSAKTGGFYSKTAGDRLKPSMHKSVYSVKVGQQRFSAIDLAYILIKGAIPDGVLVTRNGDATDFRFKNIWFERDAIKERLLPTITHEFDTAYTLEQARFHKYMVNNNKIDSGSNKQLSGRMSKRKLRSLVFYSARTGEFYPKTNYIIYGHSRPSVRHWDTYGKHTVTTIGSHTRNAAKLVFLYIKGYYPKTSVKYRNGNPYDIRFKNLYL